MRRLTIRTSLPLLALAALLPFSSPVAAQQAEAALSKSDLVRYLAGTTYTKGEIAAIVRRACLSFVPSSRDRQDLRQLGATDQIFREIDRCVSNDNRPAPAAGAATRETAPAAPPTLTVINGYASAMSGSVAYVSVDLHRGDAPVPGARLLLQGATGVPGGAQSNPEAITDASGRATFTLPAGTRAGTYRLTVAAADASPLDGPNAVSLTTLPAAPALATVTPPALAIGAGARGAHELTVTITDAFGNPVPKLAVELRPHPARAGAGVLTQQTNDAGRVQFAVQTAALQAGDSLDVAVGNRSMALVRVVPAAQVTALLLGAERQLGEGRASAVAAYDSVLSVDPTNTRALLGRGYAQSAAGQYDAATRDFQLAQREGEDPAGALTGLGYVALRRNDLAGGAARFQDALHLAPGSDAAATGLAYSTLWRIDPRQTAHRPDVLASPRPAAYPAAAADQLRAGITFLASRNPGAAVQTLDSAASGAPGWPEVFFTRALAYQAAGQSGQAITDLRRYLQLRPNAADRHDVTTRIDALGRSPGAALAYGILPGGGQFYTHQPVLGVVVLGGVASGAAWALKQTTTQQLRTFTDPFGRVDTFTVNITKRKNLAAGAAVAGAVWLAGAIEAAVHASSARGDPYPAGTPDSAPAPGRSAALPSVQPLVAIDPVTGGARWGLMLHFAMR